MSQEPRPEGLEPVALRDAQAILARARSDERDADEARERYRATGLPAVHPDETVAAHLEPGEGLVAVRRSASAGHDRRGDGEEALAGPLYLTDRRLLVLGRPNLAIELSMIDEVALAGERLLVSLRDGSGVRLEASGPRLLRVQIAAALIGARA